MLQKISRTAIPLTNPLASYISTTSRSLSSVTYDDLNKKKKSKVTVCVLGPPNAGKSTLFNRLLSKEKLYKLNSASMKSKVKGYRHKRGRAIVHDIAGTTRDRRLAQANLAGISFQLWDTAGILQQREQERLIETNSKRRSKKADTPMIIDTAIQLSHTQQAAADSDLVWLVVDGRAHGGGVPPDVVATARWLRQLHPHPPRVQVLANKLLEKNTAEQEEEQIRFLDALEHQLGFGPPVPVSALLGYGMADLAVTLHELAEPTDESETTTTVEHPLQLVIMGRQNVGKSTLLNALAAADRAVTGPLAGLTRDAVTVDLPADNIRMVDTAGMTKDYEDSLHQLALEDAMNSMKVADVVVLVLEATAGVVQQTELRLANKILTEGRALVIVVNKIDCIEFTVDYRHVDLVSQVREQLEDRYPGLRNTPIIAMSSLTKRNVARLLPVVYESQKRWNRTISTSKLNEFVRDMQDTTTPTHTKIRIKYMLQMKARPPTFLLFCNTDKVAENISNHWKRKLQDSFGFYGMEIRFQIRKSNNPFVSDTPKRSGSGLGGHAARKKRKLKSLAATYKGCTTKEEGRAMIMAATRKKHRRKRKKRQ